MFYFQMSIERENIRKSIISLHQQNRRQIEIVRLLNVSKSVVSKAIKRCKELGHTKDLPANRKLIRDRIRQNFRRSMRQMAREIGIDKHNVRHIVQKELKLKSLKLQKAQHLDDKKCETRKQRCQRLLRERGAQFQRKVLFSDEKFFSVEQPHNVQNDRVLASGSSEINKKGRIVSRTQIPAGVMVWAGVSFLGKTELIFVENGIKINANNYVTDILQAVVLLWTQQTYPNQNWIFQQDSAPAHRTRTTQEFCKNKFPAFWSPQQWPPYSPDLNQLDYAIWGILEAKICSKPHKSVGSLKRDLV